MNIQPLKLDNNDLKCANCGAHLFYTPGKDTIVCPYCGFENRIEFTKEQLELRDRQNDYFEIELKALKERFPEGKIKVLCPGCGAEVDFEHDTIATKCPYCGTPLVYKYEQIPRLVKPQEIIPFRIDQKQAKQLFIRWAKRRFFAPRKFKKYLIAPSNFMSEYMPYWVFDGHTTTSYTGERGVYYYETETYYENGEQKTRQVRRIEWYPVSGEVRVPFTNLTVPGYSSEKMPFFQIETWNFSDTAPYDPRLLSGYEAKTYSVKLPVAKKVAERVMEERIKSAIRRDIGGDEQRIHSYSIHYDQLFYRHDLMPIYYGSYKYKNKIYSFSINGQTGAVSGKTPISFWRVLYVVLLILILALLAVICFGYNCHFAQFWQDVRSYFNFNFIVMWFRFFSFG